MYTHTHKNPLSLSSSTTNRQHVLSRSNLLQGIMRKSAKKEPRTRYPFLLLLRSLIAEGLKLILSHSHAAKLVCSTWHHHHDNSSSSHHADQWRTKRVSGDGEHVFSQDFIYPRLSEAKATQHKHAGLKWACVRVLGYVACNMLGALTQLVW